MPQAAVAAVLLQHARLAFGEALGQLAAELLQRRIETRVGAPAHVASAIEHFLRAHLQNQVRMRAHEHAVARHVAQERIERRAVASLRTGSTQTRTPSTRSNCSRTPSATSSA